MLLHEVEKEGMQGEETKEKQMRKVKFRSFFLGSPQLDSDRWVRVEFKDLLLLYLASAMFLSFSDGAPSSVHWLPFFAF